MAITRDIHIRAVGFHWHALALSNRVATGGEAWATF